ncbi:glycoside hydrolase family 2 TIM barrel-domain containing protein [Agromyces seonyuensis]|uniref:DUF4982 domain-containing protein n=1 Tax=Agromyces seonyuensis TaxID=2662446 RepID=A0A6I4NVQ3_9MICO|nr:glycoside hydrolase family 2 TIM barrel-domain containing protein [Agromyces seonyuensis]MWB98410.1 DUF4982 domain-containing protein [Agromyces seonyuensis]
MTTTLFTDGWTFHRAGDETGEPVRLPHDAMIAEPRSADAATGNHGGYFPGGVYRYAKTWQVPADAAGRRYRVCFEGVYGDTVVTVDGVEVAACNSGYRAFEAPLGDLAPGHQVRIEVSVDNSKTPNSRWYTGSGIYRQVWLDEVGRRSFARDGVRFTTRSIAPEGVVDVALAVEGSDSGDIASIELADASGEVVASVELAVLDGTAAGELRIPSPQTWSAEHPHLYRARVRLLDASGSLLDERRVRLGLRTLDVDPRHGLRINGEQVLLRGACVHHDNGLLGAVTLPAAEYRRARILKENGYNAIRSSHNPLSRPFLDACDELGLYVMDELTDVWFNHKTKHDGADRFEEVWRDDARAMVAEDRNRPSVIMYSIGNEIGETATERGVKTAGEIDAFLRELDATRPTTLATNLLVSMMASRGSSPFESETYTAEPGTAKPEKKSSTAANAMTAKLGRIMELASRLPAADKASRDAFAQVRIAGYNYAYGRYAGDRKKYPERVIVGSESMPGDLPAIWKRVEAVPGVIGDFMWTGWDYLGEAGIGTWSYGQAAGGINKPFPALLAGTGAIDITGLPGAPTLLARAVWGRLEAPAIAVRPMQHAGERANKTPWRSSDAVQSWSWRGHAGKAEIEVYSADDEVELLLNGRSLGRRAAGARVGFVARFTATYEPGELVAVGYRGKRERGRSSLRSADAAALRLRSEQTGLAGPDDLAYVWVELADGAGIVDVSAEDRITVQVDGPAELAGFGNAAPITEDGYTGRVARTHDGRALAILRGTGEAGTVTLTARSERHGVDVLQFDAASTALPEVPTAPPAASVRS